MLQDYEFVDHYGTVCTYGVVDYMGMQERGQPVRKATPEDIDHQIKREQEATLVKQERLQHESDQVISRLRYLREQLPVPA